MKASDVMISAALEKAVAVGLLPNGVKPEQLEAAKAIGSEWASEGY